MRVGLVWTHISLKQARGFTVSVLVFLINMKQNHWVSLTVLAGGQFRKKKYFTHLLLQFLLSSSYHFFFLFLPLTFCLFCYSHLSASVWVCLYLCKFMLCVCVWSTDRVIWLLDKQHTQVLTASSIRMSVWWTGPVEGSDSTHASVYLCVCGQI